MNVAGIDVSTHAIDLVLLDLDSDKATWHRYELEGHDVIERVRAARDIRWVWADVFLDCVAIGIERPAGRFGVAQTSMAFGAVLANLPSRALVKPWLPSEWRKACGWPGNCSKEHAREQVRLFEPSSYHWPQDACDAYCIAYATRSVLEPVKAAA